MEILKGIEIFDLALYCEETLVISDVHIGYEEAMNKQGVLVPRMQFEDMMKKLEFIFSKLKGKKLNTIVINGDLKHEFGTISEQEWRNVLKFIDFLLKKTKSIVLIKGNHDAILEPIAKKRKVNVAKSIKFEDILIIHGDRIPKKEELEGISTIIIGHEHPAISIKEGPRTETFKCFLKGKYGKKDLIVQPSFNTLIPGTDILKEQVLSPFLKQNLGNFEIYAVEDKIYYFGKLKNIKD